MTDTLNDALEAAAQLQCLMDAAAVENQPKEKAPTAASQQAAYQKALKDLDIDKLLTLQQTMKLAIDRATLNILLAPDDMTQPKLEELLEEYVALRDIEKFYKARYDMIRTMIFDRITATHMAKGVADPAHAPGKVVVANAKKKFTREGGKAKSILDKTRLAELLGNARWNQVWRPRVVPAVPEHVEYYLDEDALLALVTKDPSVMEVFRQCATVVGHTNSTFHLRPVEESDLE